MVTRWNHRCEQQFKAHAGQIDVDAHPFADLLDQVQFEAIEFSFLTSYGGLAG
jgi:hypothetical protein